MNEFESKQKLTTSDLAARQPPPAEVKPGPGPPVRKEYTEEPLPKKAAPAAEPVAERAPLFSEDETKRFRAEWDSIQIGFVDEPRQSVEKADGLVASVIQRLATVFSEERKKLEGQWDRGEEVSTEDLRINLQRYRSFFDRLLKV